MRIIHLSDIHLSKNDLKDFKYFAMPALLDDLEENNTKKKIDMVLITGDLIDKGGISFGSIKEAFNNFEESVINPIKKTLNLGNERFFFVPGNHDISNRLDSLRIEKGLTEDLQTTEKVNEFIDEGTLEGITRILPYKEFEKSFYDGILIRNSISNFQSSYIIEIDGKIVGVNCLNTAWRCYDSDSDKEKIILGERQIVEGNDAIKDCDIKIALMHHPLDWLSVFDRENIKNLIPKYYNAVFCGHVHKGSSWSTTRSYDNIFVSVGPLSCAGNIRSNDRQYSNGYSILDYDSELGKINIDYRRYSQSALKCVDNTDLGVNGKDEFIIGNKISKKKIVNIDSSEKQEMGIANVARGEEIYSKKSEISNEFMIEKKVFDLGLIRSKHLIKDIIGRIAKYSAKYSALNSYLDLVIVLIDKLLYKLVTAYQYNDNISPIVELESYLNKINDNTENKIKVLNDIYNSILWFWCKVNSDVIPGLFECEISIPGIIDQIINLEGSDCLNDQLIKVLIEAKQTYSALNSGNDYGVDKNSEISLKCQVTLCIVLPIYLYKDKIMNWSSELQIGNSEDLELEQLFKIQKDEYLLQTLNFIERKPSIESIYNLIKDNKITIIKGKSGTGKSAIIAKLIERLSTEKYNCKFSSALIIHSFKHFKNVYDLVNSIVQQCNSKLINKIDTKILIEMQTEYSLWDSSQKQISENKFNNIYDIYKKILAEVVNNFIYEHGEIYIFVDSLELANIYENKIGYLFDDLSSNSHVVISTDENYEGIFGVTTNNSIEKNVIEIGNLNLEEMSKILDLPCGIDNNTQIIDTIYEKTKGNVKLIKGLLERVNTSGSDILNYLKNNTTEFDPKNIDIYTNLANRWILFSTDVLEDILCMLAIFESINFISLDKIQSYLRYKGFDFRLPRINKYLNRVDDQIININNKVKLSNGEFADFIISKFFSRTDIGMFVKDLFNWICKDVQRDYNFALDFFNHLVKREIISESLFRNNFDNFINQKKNNNESQYLFNMGLLMYSESNDMIQYALKMVESAVELNNSDAKGFLGYCLLKGEHIEQNISKGESLLNEACNDGNIMAKSLLGKMLIDGDYLIRDAEKGRKLLWEASTEGSINAKLSLAVMLITGRGIKPNPIQGRELLYELIDDKNTAAMLTLANFTLDGVSMERDIVEGLKLINQAIEQGSAEAKLELATRLIEGDGVTLDKAEGIRLLEELMNSGNIKAKRIFAKSCVTDGDVQRGCQLFEELIGENDSDSILTYSRLVLDGNIPEENKQRAIGFLEKEIKSNNIDAMRELGIRLIEGDGIDACPVEGIKQLEKAVNMMDIPAMRELGYKLANGIDISRNKERGELLLQAAIEHGDIPAKALYALTLTRNYTDQENKVKALQLLEEAVSYGYKYAKLKLASILFRGKLIKKDVKRAAQLLEDCILSGDRQSERILGYRLLNGTGIPYDIDRAKELLISSTRKGDRLAKIILGEAIILGYFKEYQIEYGIQLLEQSLLKEPMAEKVLGTLLVKGINIPQDKVNGERLLRSAAEKGNIESIRELYDMLLDGRYLQQDIEEGKRYLMKAIEANDDLARIDLAERLLDGDILPKNRVEGQRIFDELVAKENLDALCNYGERLILGDGVIKDKARGEKLLRQSIDLGSIDAKRKLALRILYDDIDESDREEAITFIEENILELDERTMIIYGNMLIDGEKVEADVDRGLKLLEECSLIKNSVSKYYLGKRLVEGKHVKQDIGRGLALLEEGVSEGNDLAKIYLAELNIEGKYAIKNVTKGLNILNNMVLDGNEDAKGKLAFRLIKGDHVRRDIDKGLSLIIQLVDKKNVQAIKEYGEMLLDGFYVKKDLKLGQKLLQQAIKNEDYYASYLMGRRLISGNGVRKHKARGIKEIKKAIKHDIIDAAFEYGVRLKNGIDVVINIDEGKTRIEGIISTSSADEKYSLGLIAYKLKDYALATQLFYDSYTNKVEQAAVSLAYMLRRNEIRGEVKLPSIDKLLEEPIKNNDQNAYVNLALYYIRNSEKLDNWEKIDNIFNNLDYCGGSVDWWYEISKLNDLEGELVLGLMDRYGLIPELSDIPFVDRLNKVCKDGWNLPKVVFQEINAFDQAAPTKE